MEVRINFLCTLGKHSTRFPREFPTLLPPQVLLCSLLSPVPFSVPSSGPFVSIPAASRSGLLAGVAACVCSSTGSPLANLFPTHCLLQPVCTAGTEGEADNYLMRPHNADSQLKYPWQDTPSLCLKLNSNEACPSQNLPHHLEDPVTITALYLTSKWQFQHALMPYIQIKGN